MSQIHKEVPLVRVQEQGVERRSDLLAIEAEVGLSVNGDFWLSFRCSPESLEELAVGFLYNEGYITSMVEIGAVTVSPRGEHVEVWLHHPLDRPRTWSRTSGCFGASTSGGASSPDHLDASVSYIRQDIAQAVDVFLGFPMERESAKRGVHTTLLIDSQRLLAASSDIGRHNTLDKLAGLCLLRALRLEKPLLVTSGRISSEMITKATRMGVPLVISLHSVSVAAIELAEKANVTLIGHARRQHFDIYTKPNRIADLL